MSRKYLLSSELPDQRLLGLRRPEAEDLGAYLNARNDPELYPFLSITIPMSRAEEEEWLKRQTAALGNAPSDIVFSIDADSHLVGYIGLHRISWVHRSATIAVAIFSAEHRKKGIGTGTYQLIARFAFQHLNLESIRAGVIDGNEGSRKLHERCGFRHVGMFERGWWKNGVWKAEHLYELTREKWLELQAIPSQ